MRAITVLKNLVAVISIFIRGFEFTGDGVIVDVRPTWRRPRCSQCQRRGFEPERAVFYIGQDDRHDFG